jgi:hypothetical protein
MTVQDINPQPVNAQQASGVGGEVRAEHFVRCHFVRQLSMCEVV